MISRHDPDPPVLDVQHMAARRGAMRPRIDALHVRAGQIVCVVDPNGGGKSALLMTALGLLPHQGYVRLDGRI